VPAPPIQDRLSPLFRDLAAGLFQQMFFWGKDVVHPAGNLFLRTGFEKRPSTGLTGTSCYSLPWQGGSIELHGAHAGWFGDDGGFLFVRPLGRCLRWLEATPPVPGEWDGGRYQRRADPDLHAAARPFFDWWLSQEASVLRLTQPGYREACFRHFKKLPKTRAWLRPADGIRWIEGLRDHPETLPRARRFTSASS